MATTRRIHITKLASHTVTRSRGYLAYGNLRPYLRSAQNIEIDLTGDYPVSLSFLDELVHRLSEEGHLDQVTFVVDQGDVFRKLSRIADIRKVDIPCLDAKTANRKKVTPLAGARTETVSVGVKSIPAKL